MTNDILSVEDYAKYSCPLLTARQFVLFHSDYSNANVVYYTYNKPDGTLVCSADYDCASEALNSGISEIVEDDMQLKLIHLATI